MSPIHITEPEVWQLDKIANIRPAQRTRAAQGLQPHRPEAHQHFIRFVVDLVEIGEAFYATGIFVVVGDRPKVAKWLVDLVTGQRPDLASTLTLNGGRQEYIVDVSSSDPWPSF